MQRWSLRYAAAAILVQTLMLAGCDDTPSAAPPQALNQMTPAAPPPAATPTGPARLVLAFGDSLYAGYGLSRGQSLPDALQAGLRADGINATIVNAGVSGDTTAAGRKRLAFTLDNMPSKPDLVLLGLGGNDALRQLPPRETRANMVAMLDELRRRDIPVVLTGMLAPPNLGPDYADAFNAIWPDLAADYDATLYPFILDGVIGDRALMLPDNVHPNAQGVTRIAGKLTPILTKTLD